MRNIFIALLFVLALSACKKDIVTPFDGKDGISFYYFTGREADSINYSFADNVGELEKDTVFIKMRVTGKAAPHARNVELIAVDSLTTAKEGVHFILPKVVLPADSLNLLYPVILNNTEDLEENSYKLTVTIKENADFIKGANGQADVQTRNETVFLVNFTNQLIEPVYWYYIEGYFGKYSKAKHKFMIDELGVADFSPDWLGGTFTYSDFINHRSYLKTRLAEYNSIHGTLLDENGDEVTFP